MNHYKLYIRYVALHMVWRPPHHMYTYNIPFVRLHEQPTTQIGSSVPLVRLILPQGKYAVCYI